MKKQVLLFVLLVLVLTGCADRGPEPMIPEGNDAKGIYQLTFKAQKRSDDCVGDDWSVTYFCDGQRIESGYQITRSLEVFSFCTVEVEIREADFIDDVGGGRLHVAVYDGGSGKTEITVTETGGKYKGDTAVWEILWEVKLVGRKPGASTS